MVALVSPSLTVYVLGCVGDSSEGRIREGGLSETLGSNTRHNEVGIGNSGGGGCGVA
jgi:hypothetical protein